jgi:hypothetical protein
MGFGAAVRHALALIHASRNRASASEQCCVCTLCKRSPCGRRLPPRSSESQGTYLVGLASAIDEPLKGDRRNIAAVTLSRLDASKGGRARAAVLPAEERRAIAKKAAAARWAKKERADSPEQP